MMILPLLHRPNSGGNDDLPGDEGTRATPVDAGSALRAALSDSLAERTPGARQNDARENQTAGSEHRRTPPARHSHPPEGIERRCGERRKESRPTLLDTRTHRRRKDDPTLPHISFKV